MKYYYQIIFLGIFDISHAQEYIYVSANGLAKFTRVEFGFSKWSITQLDSAQKFAYGVSLQEQIKVISGFYDQKMEKAVAIHDAFYFKLNLGKMISEPHYSNSFNGETEKKFSSLTDFGYLLCTGYKCKRWSAMLGPDIKFSRVNVGGVTFPSLNSSLFYRTISFILRGEFCTNKNKPNKRLSIMLWTNMKSLNDPLSVSNHSGLIEIPFSNNGRFKLMAQYTLMGGIAEDYFRDLQPTFSKINEFRIGLRVGFPP